jgi:hypothetical protein
VCSSTDSKSDAATSFFTKLLSGWYISTQLLSIENKTELIGDAMSFSLCK